MNNRKNCGIILSHGLFGNPKEYESLEILLKAIGYDVLCPSLLGHGQYLDIPFKDISAEEIVKQFQKDCEPFIQAHQKIAWLGHSLGAPMSALIASKFPEKSIYLMLLGAPYNEGYFVNAFHKIFKLSPRRLLKGLRYKHQGFTNLETPKTLSGVSTLLKQEAPKLFRELEKSLSEITCPVTLAHSQYDLIVPYEEMDKYKTALYHAQNIQVLTLEGCGHQIFPTNKTQLQVSACFIENLERCLSQDTSASI